MKIIKKIYPLLLCALLFVFTGCSSNDMEEQGNDDNAFSVYDINGINFYNEYSVSNLEQEVIIYFPVVSNKMITSTQLGGIATLLNLKNPNDNEQQSVKVKLIAQKQDKLNTEYHNFYISFLKYKLEIDNTVDLSLYSSIDLCDTTIWVYFEEEYQTLKFNDTYMRINIIDSNDSLSTPQWDQVLSNMQNEIKEKLI